jgi:predicted ATP-dependent endonuclease of OLD family
MFLHGFRVRNFHRLKNTWIDLETDLSIMVGPNNSGKTSASHPVKLFFTGERRSFSVNDFSVSCWEDIRVFGENAPDTSLSSISIDFWFRVEDADLHRVVSLLPDLSWQETTLAGVRVELVAANPEDIKQAFQAARERARTGHEDVAGAAPIELFPRTLKEYLEDHLTRDFELRICQIISPRFGSGISAFGRMM